MGDNENDENVVKNGTLSSPDSVDALVQTDSAETTTTSDLPSTSGYRPLDNSPHGSTQSKSYHASLSDGTISDLSSDVTTPVNTPQSQSAASAYSGTRFVVKRMASSELQSTSNSPSKDERTPSQSPKSVKFVVDEAGPSKGKSPEKSPGGLSKSITTGALSKLLDLAPRQLFSPKSQDSFPSKEEIELPAITRAISTSFSDSDEEDYFAGVDIEGDRSGMPLLTDSETHMANVAKSLKAIDVRGPDGVVSTVAVEEIPNSPGHTDSDGTETIREDAACRKCLLNSALCYVAVIVLVFAVGSTTYGVLYYTGVFGPAVDNDTSIFGNETLNITTPFPLTILKLDDIRKASGELSIETTTNALPSMNGPEKKEGATDALSFDHSTTTTTMTTTTTGAATAATTTTSTTDATPII